MWRQPSFDLFPGFPSERTGYKNYLPACPGGTRWVRVDIDEAEIPSDSESGLFLVLDIPTNTAAGLGFPDPAGRDFLAVDLKTFPADY